VWPHFFLRQLVARGGRRACRERYVRDPGPGGMRDSCAATTYVALAADGLVAVVLGGKGLERRLNDTTTETEDQVEGRLLWRLSV
jgi:hypothetical protein